MRCKKCVIVSECPGSDFDENGVCTWCRSGFPNYHPLGIGPLRDRLMSGLRERSEVDCVVGVSGGKDSTFALWVMKEYFGLRVHAFTYDHSGVASFARENVHRVCSLLDVPLTVCALPDDSHARSFNHYFRSYIQHPSTVTAGLTCVACKHLHVFGTELAVEKRAPFVVWAKCPLEDSPFLALKPVNNSTSRDGIAKGAALLAGEIMQAPSLIGAVLRNFTLTMKGCLAVSPTTSYMKARYRSVQQIALFEYWPWDSTQICSTLQSAGWQKPTGVPSDWHSDCDFHAIKEYMFQKVLGVSYTDGFLSNQIRAGLLTREQAMVELAASKQHFARALEPSMVRRGLSEFFDQIDPECFQTVVPFLSGADGTGRDAGELVSISSPDTAGR